MTTLNQTTMVQSLLVPNQVEEVEVAARLSDRMACLCAISVPTFVRSGAGGVGKGVDEGQE